jgi:hypothetical protein
VTLQDVEHGVVDPAVMTELDRHPHPPRQTAQEVVEPAVVTDLVRHELDEEDAAAVGELVPAGDGVGARSRIRPSCR